MKFKTPRYSVSRKQIKGQNRFAASDSVAVIFCPSPSGKVFGVSVARSDLSRVLDAGFWRVANHYPGRFKLYAYAFIYVNGERKRILLHRFVTDAPDGTEVDHRNHRGTDNRRENLRVCTHQENMMNQRRFAEVTA